MTQKKILAVLLACVMLVATFVPMTVSAAEPADNGISVRFVANTEPKKDGTIVVSVYFSGKNIKSLMPAPSFDENYLTPTYGVWAIDSTAIVGGIPLSVLASVQEAWIPGNEKPPVITFTQSVTLNDVKLLDLYFNVVDDAFAPGVNNLVSFGEVRYALMPAGGVETTYNNITNPELVTLEPYTITVACNHNYAINRYNGLMTCSVCNEVCPHENWTNSVCDSCGLACTHDWSYKGNVATCAICAKTCASHAKKGLFLDCATCGYDMAIANSYYGGNSMITDTDNTLETAHGFKMNLQLTVGSKDTIVHTKDTSRDDNIYYSNVDSATTGSDYYSLVSWLYTKEGSTDITDKSILSLWLETTDEYSSRVDGNAPEGFVEPKLWLTVAADSTKKICEIKAGETYDVTMYYDVANGWCILEVKLDGEIAGSYKLNASDFSGTLSSSKIRLGETYTAKRLHVQKISFEDVIFSDTYENGACYVCGIECTHRYNVGGYCADCGVLGDPITFNDKTGTSAFSITDNNIGAYKSSNTSTVGIWRIFDETEMLLGHDYVMDMDVKFTEAFCDSSITNTGTTSRFAIWADADVETTTSNTKFGIFIRTLADNDQVVLLGFRDDFKVSDPHMTFNLNEKHNLRIAIRSNPTATAGTYDHTAEVYLDGKLVYTQAFTLTAENGMAVSVGDHTRRICCARSEIDSTFGIHFLDDTVEYIGAQEKENADYSADEKFDIRFVFGFDDLYLEDVGVKVEASVSDGTKGEKVLAANNVALTAISVNGVEKQVGVNGIGYGGYYMATAIKDIDLDLANTYTFKLTPYIEKQYASEVTYMPYSYEITVSFDSNAKMVIDYNKIG